MPKVEQTINLLDDSFQLVTLQHGDEIPDWAIPRITNPAAICSCGDVVAPIIPETVEPPVLVDVVDYSTLNRKELDALCTERGLDITGNKPDLIERLEESDAAADASEDDEVDVWSLDLAELTKLAQERGIDIGDATGSEEIAALIMQAAV